NPVAYAKLRDYNPREYKRDPALDRFCEGTHAYGTAQQRARRPSRMFELGPERVRALVQPEAMRWLEALENWKGGSMVCCGTFVRPTHGQPSPPPPDEKESDDV